MSPRRLSMEAEHAADFVGLAETYLLLWSQAVETQARRVLDAIVPNQQGNGVTSWGFEDGHAALVDTAFMVLALRNLELSAQRLLEALSLLDSLDNEASDALVSFRGRVNDLEALRHAFVHFEDYGFGTGNAQRSGGRPAPMRLGHEVGSSRYVLTVRDAGKVLTLDVADARDAARELGFEMLMAVDGFEGAEAD